MSNYIGARIQVTTTEGKYEGILHSVDAITKRISLEKAKALPSGQKYVGLLNFHGQEIQQLEVFEEDDEEEKHKGVKSESGTTSQDVSQPNPEKVDADQDSPEVFDTYPEAEESAWYRDYPHDSSEGNISGARNSQGIGTGPWQSSSLVQPHIQPDSSANRHTEQQLTDAGNGKIHAGHVTSHVSQGTSHTGHGTSHAGHGTSHAGHGTSRAGNGMSHAGHGTSAPVDSRGSSHQSPLENHIFIEHQNELYVQAMEDVAQQHAIGLVVKGVQIGRRGKLSLLLILCEDRVYVFDALSLGPSLFTKDFIDILESTSVAKVMHDCRFASDLFYHQNGIQLSSVFDTQVGDLLIRKRQYKGDFPRNVSGITECLLEYLDIDIQDISVHLEHNRQIAEDESSWLQRPLSPINLRCAILDTTHLLVLHEAVTEQLMAEFTCAIDIYLAVERDALEVDTRKISARAAHVPKELMKNLFHKVSQMSITTGARKPKELSVQPAGSETGSSSKPVARQSSGESRASKTETGEEGQTAMLNWKFQLTSQGMIAKPQKTGSQVQARSSAKMEYTSAVEEHKEDDADLYVSSENSDADADAFGDDELKDAWQNRHAEISTKSNRAQFASTGDNTKRESYPAPETARMCESSSSGGDRNTSDKMEPNLPGEMPVFLHASPGRGKPVSHASGIRGAKPSTVSVQLQPGLSKAVVQRANEFSGCVPTVPSACHEQILPATKSVLKKSPPQQSQNASNVGSRTTSEKHNRVVRDPVPASYADVLLGQTPEEERNIRAKLSLKAIGKALAAGGKFYSEGDDDEADDQSQNSNKSLDEHGFSPHHVTAQKSHGRGSFSNLPSQMREDTKTNPQGVHSSVHHSPRPRMGRGRARSITHLTEAIHTQPPQQLKKKNTIGDSRGRVQCDFPSAEEMQAAPESIPVATGSVFMSQRPPLGF